MNWFSAIRRCEELTMEVAALRKEVSDLKKVVKAKDAEIQDKYKKIGNLLTDNCRLIKVNALLAEQLGKNPRRRRVDDEGNMIKQPK